MSVTLAFAHRKCIALVHSLLTTSSLVWLCCIYIGRQCPSQGDSGSTGPEDGQSGGCDPQGHCQESGRGFQGSIRTSQSHDRGCLCSTWSVTPTIITSSNNLFFGLPKFILAHSCNWAHCSQVSLNMLLINLGAPCKNFSGSLGTNFTMCSVDKKIVIPCRGYLIFACYNKTCANGIIPVISPYFYL